MSLFVGCSKEPEAEKVQPVITQHHEPPTPTVIPDYDGPLIEVVKADVESQEWKDALSMLANQKFASKRHYSLARIIKSDGMDDSPVLLGSRSLRKLTKEVDNGSSFYKAQDGDFVIWEHIRAYFQNANSPDPRLVIANAQAGSLFFETKFPKAGVINVIGDIIVHPCPEKRMGQVQINLEKTDDIKAGGFYIGTVTAGGNLSTYHKFDANGQSQRIDLAPGQYKLLLTKFSRKTGLSEFIVEEGKTTELKFKAISQAEVEKM
ncbi:MAG: hypothetical protein CMJ19_08915 [Phycisphaeraceae bacterium]|nr:hypothetical protein [Phycisphaeraceae bacterium]